jgi:hypothetical protein
MPSYSGLWNGVYGVNYSALASNGNTFEQNNRLRNTITKLISKDRGTRKLMALLRALNGVAPGGTATSQFKTISSDVQRGQPMTNGGKRTIDTKLDMNRATTAADVTSINAMLDKLYYPTYPVDRSRNGGGGKRNSF